MPKSTPTDNDLLEKVYKKESVVIALQYKANPQSDVRFEGHAQPEFPGSLCVDASNVTAVLITEQAQVASLLTETTLDKDSELLICIVEKGLLEKVEIDLESSESQTVDLSGGLSKVIPLFYQSFYLFPLEIEKPIILSAPNPYGYEWTRKLKSDNKDLMIYFTHQLNDLADGVAAGKGVGMLAKKVLGEEDPATQILIEMGEQIVEAARKIGNKDV